MRRVHIVLSMVIVLLAGACGSSSTTLAEPSPGTPTEGVERLLAAAADAEVSSLRMSLEAEFGGLAEFGGETVSFGVEAAFTADGDEGEMRLDFGELMEAAVAQEPGALGAEMAGHFGDSIEMRFIGDTVYMSSGFWSWLMPIDTPWVAFSDDGSSGVDSGFDMETFSAEEFLAILGAVDADAALVGTEVIDGVETQHIRGRASAAELAAIDPTFLEDLDPTGTGAIDIEIFDVDAWIGPDDVLRRLTFGVEDLAAVDPTAPAGAFVRFTLELSDVGAPIDVVAPSDSDVTWMDDLFSSAFEFES